MEPPLTISCSQARLPVDGVGCIQLSCWPKESHRNPQNPRADAKTQGCSLRADISTPLLRAISTQLTENGVEVVPTWNLHSYVLLRFVQEHTLQATKRETRTPIQVIELLTYNLSCLQNTLGQWWWHELVGVANQCLI